MSTAAGPIHLAAVTQIKCLEITQYTIKAEMRFLEPDKLIWCDQSIIFAEVNNRAYVVALNHDMRQLGKLIPAIIAVGQIQDALTCLSGTSVLDSQSERHTAGNREALPGWLPQSSMS